MKAEKAKTIRQDPRWPRAHVRLRQIYEERVPEGMSQAEFGAEYGLGSQGMVWQYLNGYTPLNVEAAAKFANGLRCTIYDISPEMADFLREGILPLLGRKVAQIALLALFALPPFLAPRAEAATGHNIFCANFVAQVVDAIHIVRRWLERLMRCFALRFLTIPVGLRTAG